MPLDVLVDMLARADWGPLGGRAGSAARTVMCALVTRLPHRSAEGQAANAALAESGGCSTRTITRGLARLEALGLIERLPGHIHQGRPVPSWVRVQKAALVALIRELRDAWTPPAAVDLARKGIRKLRATLYARRQSQGDTKSTHTPSGGGTGRRWWRRRESAAPPAVPAPPRPDEMCRSCGMTAARHTPQHQLLMSVPRHDYVPMRH